MRRSDLRFFLFSSVQIFASQNPVGGSNQPFSPGIVIKCSCDLRPDKLGPHMRIDRSSVFNDCFKLSSCTGLQNILKQLFCSLVWVGRLFVWLLRAHCLLKTENFTQYESLRVVQYGPDLSILILTYHDIWNLSCKNYQCNNILTPQNHDVKINLFVLGYQTGTPGSSPARTQARPSGISPQGISWDIIGYEGYERILKDTGDIYDMMLDYIHTTMSFQDIQLYPTIFLYILIYIHTRHTFFKHFIHWYPCISFNIPIIILSRYP